VTALRLFKCPEYAATITTTACASRHSAASAAFRPGSSAHIAYALCVSCPVGVAHAAGRDADVVYTERLVAGAAAPQSARSSAPITTGAPVPDVDQQQREAARRERRQAYERARSAARRKGSRDVIDWTLVTESVKAWLRENPNLMRKELHARAVRELGLTCTRGRFSCQMANRLGTMREVAVSTGDARVLAHMRPHAESDPSRGWRWHAESLRAAGMRVSADRVRRALRELRGGAKGRWPG